MDDKSRHERLAQVRDGVTDVFKAGADAVKGGFRKGVKTVSLHDYRQSMEAAIAQMVEVLSAHEAELASLRHRLAKLEGKDAEA